MKPPGLQVPGVLILMKIKEALLADLEDRKRRIASGKLLHDSLNGVLIIMLLGFHVIVVSLDEPGYILMTAGEVALHERKHGSVEFLALGLGKHLICLQDEGPEMRHTEALGGSNLFAEFGILLIHIEEGLHIGIEGIVDHGTGKAGALSAVDPVNDRIGGGSLLREKASFLCPSFGFEISEFLLHLFNITGGEGFEDPGVAQSIAIIKHLLHVILTEALGVCHFADVSLHIAGSGAQNIIHSMFLCPALNIAEGTFSCIGHSI